MVPKIARRTAPTLIGYLPRPNNPHTDRRGRVDSAMAKARQVFVCSACGSLQTKWMGKCPECGAWDTLAAETVHRAAKTDPRGAALGTWAGGGGGAPGTEPAGAAAAELRPLREAHGEAQRLGEVAAQGGVQRLRTGIDELDRVLGGGLVPGSAVLVGGDPGIGKSTLLLQAARALAERGTRVLYVSSEESAQQVAMRAGRVTPSGEPGEGPGENSSLKARERTPDRASKAPSKGADLPGEFFLLAEASLARVLDQASRVLSESAAPVLIIDSVQMIYHPDVPAFPGSMTQLRRCAAELVYFAKATGAAVIVVGHVTKEGLLAGPRMLEHLVDAVLYFEGDRYHAHRLLRCVKNRFGSTLELGLMEMTGAGLRAADRAGLAAALQHGAAPRPGTVVCPVLTGSRCLLVEIQALTATGFPGAVKRKSSGLDANRLAMIIAVLEQHAGLRLADRDVFASAVGGVRVAEPAADLALLLAIAGAHFKRSVPGACAVVGEVGLGGEVRPVAQLEARVREATRLGAKVLIVPKAGAKAPRLDVPAGVDVVSVATVNAAMEQLA